MNDKEHHELDPAFDAAKLIGKYLRDELSDSEPVELDSWIEQSQEHQDLFSDMADVNERNDSVSSFYAYNTEKAHKRLMGRIRPWRFGVLYLTRNRQVAAVLAVAILVAAVVVYKLQSERNAAPLMSTGSLLIRSDGSIVEINKLQPGQSIKDGNVRIKKSDSKTIKYESPVAEPAEPGYNAVITSAASAQHVEFADGSEVAMKENSKILYPLTFNGNTNEVSVLGEAQFDSREALKPFKVETLNHIQVTVLGAKFSIHVDGNEAQVKTPSIGSSITVSGNKLTIKFKSGMKPVVDTAKNQIKLVAKTDEDGAADWKSRVLNNRDDVDMISLMWPLEAGYGIQLAFPYNMPDVQLTSSIGSYPNSGEFIKGFNVNGTQIGLGKRY